MHLYKLFMDKSHITNYFLASLNLRVCERHKFLVQSLNKRQEEKKGEKGKRKEKEKEENVA